MLADVPKGVRLAYAKDWQGTLTETSSTIDVAMAMAKAWPEGLDAVADVLVTTGREADDNQLWATVGYLSSLLPEGDPDAVAWTSLVRSRRGLGTLANGVVTARERADRVREANSLQPSLFDVDLDS
jgi:hypothetical protein